MDLAQLQNQVGLLHGLKLQQQTRLENARKEIEGAMIGLQKIEGALEILEWVKSQLQAGNEVAAPPSELPEVAVVNGILQEDGDGGPLPPGVRKVF
jgi:hypothetical protein